MDIKITIEGLDQLTEAIALLGGAVAYLKGASAEDAVELVEEVKASREEPTPETKPEPDARKDAPTREEVRAVFVQKNSKDNRGKLKGILDKYGAENISTLGEEHFTDVLKDLEAI